MPCSHVLMVRPHRFFSNPQTLVNNVFQSGSAADLTENALKEFDDLVQLLHANEVIVTVCQDTAEPETPDAIFPNNWISFHEDKSIFLYPMFAENRRLERKKHVLDTVSSLMNISRVNDLSGFEHEGVFLEGTGSMVLDRKNKIAYAAISDRTDERLLKEFCKTVVYHPIAFFAVDGSGIPIYHTNVLMCIGENFVVCCMESVAGSADKEVLKQSFRSTGKELIYISLNQMEQFAGNMLELQNTKAERLLLMSRRAYQSLNPQQISSLSKYARIIHTGLEHIENAGGGSARCMIAELYGSFK